VRSRDAYIGLGAAAALFFAAVFRAAGVEWYAVMLLPLVALGLVAILGWRVRVEPKVLLVGGPDGDGRRQLEVELDEAGYMVVGCPGPERRKGGCPVTAGRDCPVRWSPASAVVFEASHHSAVRPPCRQGLGIPVLTLAEGSSAAISRSDGEARMGLDRPVREVILEIHQQVA
jgi:hypothetical protein